MKPEVMLGLAVLSLASWGAVDLVWKAAAALSRRWVRRTQPAPAVVADTSPTAPRSAWQPTVCGTRLELGASGFYITFDVSQPLATQYRLYTPEHELVSLGSAPQGLKQLGVQLASDRAEFAPVGPVHHFPGVR